MLDSFVASIVPFAIVVISVNYVRTSLFSAVSLTDDGIRFLESRTIKISFNLTFIPDFRQLSSSASQQLQTLINQTLSSALKNVIVGGFRPDLVQIV